MPELAPLTLKLAKYLFVYPKSYELDLQTGQRRTNVWGTCLAPRRFHNAYLPRICRALNNSRVISCYSEGAVRSSCSKPASCFCGRARHPRVLRSGRWQVPTPGVPSIWKIRQPERQSVLAPRPFRRETSWRICLVVLAKLMATCTLLCEGTRSRQSLLVSAFLLNPKT